MMNLNSSASRSMKRNFITGCLMGKGWWERRGLVGFTLLILWTFCVWKWEPLTDLTSVVKSRYNNLPTSSKGNNDDSEIVSITASNKNSATSSSSSSSLSSSSSSSKRAETGTAEKDSDADTLTSPSLSRKEERGRTTESRESSDELHSDSELSFESDVKLPHTTLEGGSKFGVDDDSSKEFDADRTHRRPVKDVPSSATDVGLPAVNDSLPASSRNSTSSFISSGAPPPLPNVTKDNITARDSAALSNEVLRPTEVSAAGNENRDGESNNEERIGESGNEEENSSSWGAKREGSTPSSTPSSRTGTGAVASNTAAKPVRRVTVADDSPGGNPYPTSSCRSRDRIRKYLSKQAPEVIMSPHFRSRFERYEQEHRACVTLLSKKLAKSDLQHLMKNIYDDEDVRDGGGYGDENETLTCKYLIWTTSNFHGLGNKLISLAGAFVYALLTNRTILIEGQSGLENLICEPFSGSSWFFPNTTYTWPYMHYSVEIVDLATWPSSELERCLNSSFPEPADIETERKCRSRVSKGAPIAKTHFNQKMWKDSQGEWKFFCDDHQDMISKATWFYYVSNQFPVPGYYLIPSFRRQLHELFPDGHVFTIIGRLLFLPIDDLWTHIEDVYDKHLANAATRVGVQIRTFRSGYLEAFQLGALDCMITSSVLPPPRDALSTHSVGINRRESLSEEKDASQLREVVSKAVTNVEEHERTEDQVPVIRDVEDSMEEEQGDANENAPSFAEKSDVVVFIASLSRKYRDVFEQIYANQTMDDLNSVLGEEWNRRGGLKRKVVTWHQESSENTQHTEDIGHNQRAFMEMWLLSLSDHLFTSQHSTFGYVAQGLSGLVPYIIPVCVRPPSSGICYVDSPTISTLVEGCAAPTAAPGTSNGGKNGGGGGAVEAKVGSTTEELRSFLSPSALERELRHCVLHGHGIQLP